MSITFWTLGALLGPSTSKISNPISFSLVEKKPPLLSYFIWSLARYRRKAVSAYLVSHDWCHLSLSYARNIVNRYIVLIHSITSRSPFYSSLSPLDIRMMIFKVHELGTAVFLESLMCLIPSDEI